MKLTSHALFASVALAATGLLVSACPGEIENPAIFLTGAGGGADACSLDVEADIFQEKCNTSTCHNASDEAANLDLESPGIASRVVGVDGECTGVLADPDNPEESLLYTKLDSSPGCGLQMPLGGELSDEEKSCILEWIGDQMGGGPTSTSSGGGMGGMGGMPGAGGSGGAGGN